MGRAEGQSSGLAFQEEFLKTQNWSQRGNHYCICSWWEHQELAQMCCVCECVRACVHACVPPNAMLQLVPASHVPSGIRPAAGVHSFNPSWEAEACGSLNQKLANLHREFHASQGCIDSQNKIKIGRREKKNP